jgi:glycosyltransferase involved in cell wall biosynthesis
MIKELIEPGITGALYQGDEKGLGEAIHELLKQPQRLKEWGKNSKEHIQKNYALSNTIDKLEELLKPLATTF